MILPFGEKVKSEVKRFGGFHFVKPFCLFSKYFLSRIKSVA